MDYLDNHIEALIFSAPEPIGVIQIQGCMAELFDANITITTIEESIHKIGQKYKSETSVFEILEIAGGYRFFTKPAYSSTIQVFVKQNSGRRLSASALESLAIVAYKQPVNKSEIEKIRGVNSDYALQKLLEKELIYIVGKSDSPGRPLLYGTSQKFMDYFGLKSIKELPQLKDIETDKNVSV